jgi:hypothetical protein
MLRPEHGRLPGALTEGRGIRRTTLYSRPERPIRRLILHSPHWRPRFHYRFPPTERGYSGRLPPSGSRLFCGRNVRNHPVPSHLTDTNAGSVRSQQQPLRSNRSRTYKSAPNVHPTGIPGIRTVLAHSIAGAFGRSESALAKGDESSKVRVVQLAFITEFSVLTQTWSIPVVSLHFGAPSSLTAPFLHA